MYPLTPPSYAPMCQDAPPCRCLGLSWDVTNGVNIDLDASIAGSLFIRICFDCDQRISCLKPSTVLDDKFNVIDTIFFRQLISKDLAIRHCGDEREGDAVGDDEKILIDLSKISPNGTYLCSLICS